MNDDALALVEGETAAAGLEPILTTYRGSIAHGTYEQGPLDDIDLITIGVADRSCYLGLGEWGNRGTREIARGSWDLVAYELRKALGMMMQGNPNILSMLWVEPKHVLESSPQGDALIEDRELFATKHAYKSFVGYAHGQLQRIDRSTGLAEKMKVAVARAWVDTGRLRLQLVEREDGLIPVLVVSLWVENWKQARWLQHEFIGDVQGCNSNGWWWRGAGASAAKFLRAVRPLLPEQEERIKQALEVEHAWSTRGRAPQTREEVERYRKAAEALGEPLSRAAPVPGDPEDTGRYDTAYMGEKRRAMVEEFGFDTKNASHLIRLLRMGTEFLRTGELVVFRPDASELLAIKHGEWSLEKVKAEAEWLFGEAKHALEHSELPDEPRAEDVGRLAERILMGALELKHESNEPVQA